MQALVAKLAAEKTNDKRYNNNDNQRFEYVIIIKLTLFN